jgi:hypothetical protein
MGFAAFSDSGEETVFNRLIFFSKNKTRDFGQKKSQPARRKAFPSRPSAVART